MIVIVINVVANKEIGWEIKPSDTVKSAKTMG